MTVEELIDELSKVEDKTMEVNFPYSHGTQENGNPMNVDSISVFDDYTGCILCFTSKVKNLCDIYHSYRFAKLKYLEVIKHQ